jgi:hypothetical protein
VGSSLAERVCKVTCERALEQFRVLLDEDNELVHRLGSRRLVICRDHKQPLPQLPGILGLGGCMVLTSRRLRQDAVGIAARLLAVAMCSAKLDGKQAWKPTIPQTQSCYS